MMRLVSLDSHTRPIAIAIAIEVIFVARNSLQKGCKNVNKTFQADKLCV